MKKLPIIQLTIPVILSIFLLFSQYSAVYSSPEDELENEIEDTQEEIAEHESLLEQIEGWIDDILHSNYSVTKQISLLNQEITAMQEQIADKDAEIDKKL